jgi:hypothetical protein
VVDGERVVHLDELALREISLVAFAANPLAAVTVAASEGYVDPTTARIDQLEFEARAALLEVQLREMTVGYDEGAYAREMLCTARAGVLAEQVGLSGLAEVPTMLGRRVVAVPCRARRTDSSGRRASAVSPADERAITRQSGHYACVRARGG